MTQTKSLPYLSLIAIFTILQTGLQAQIWTRPETAKKESPDYVLQGEYRGKLRVQGQEKPAGAQVIARGNGAFRLVVYPGGLPGQGWNGEKRFKLESKRQKKQVLFEADKNLPFAKAILQKGKMTLSEDSGQIIGKLKKGKRRSPTLGQKPPEDAVVLFDGTEETLEKHWNDGANMTEDGLLTEGATTTTTFQDARIHLEFRLPFKPNASGQSRGNSGFYVHGRYEVQMLDSFGLQPQNNHCGGIYGVRPPDVNMTFPPLSWQTYDVKFQSPEFSGNEKTSPARMTVMHNGEVIHENVSLKSPTGGNLLDDNPEPGPLHLQNHGNPVRYRNIWVVPLD